MGRYCATRRRGRSPPTAAALVAPTGVVLNAVPELYVLWEYVTDPELFDIEIDVDDGGGWVNLVTDAPAGWNRDYLSDEVPEGGFDYRVRIRARNGLVGGPWSEYVDYP